MTIIACGLVIAIITVVSEFRILKRDANNERLKTIIRDREGRIKKISDISLETLEDYEATYHVLMDFIDDEDEIYEMVEKKRHELRR